MSSMSSMFKTVKCSQTLKHHDAPATLGLGMRSHQELHLGPGKAVAGFNPLYRLIEIRIQRTLGYPGILAISSYLAVQCLSGYGCEI